MTEREHKTHFTRLYFDIPAQHAFLIDVVAGAFEPIDLNGLRVQVLGFVFGTDHLSRRYVLIHYREIP